MSNATNTALLRHLIRTRGSRCEFCGKPVVCVSLIRRRDRVKVTTHHVTYRNRRGEIVTGLTATVEHVQRRADGGGNGEWNVAVACFFCNAERNGRHHPKRQTCKQCGRPYKEGGGRRGRSCIECHRLASRYFCPDDFGTSLGPLIIEALAWQKPEGGNDG